MIRIGINGIGRIGKSVFRAAIDRKNIEIVLINDLCNINSIANYLKYDSVHGTLKKEIKVTDNYLIIDNKKIIIENEKNPQNINWRNANIDIVIESTGLFLNSKLAKMHIHAGARKVIISAPTKDETPMFVMGVNHNEYHKNMHIISNASCTTNCLAPIVKVIHDKFVITEGLMSTVHATTNSQSSLDRISDSNNRLNRSSLMNIIPHSTGAAIALGRIIPNLNNKITGISFRIPTANVSLLDFNFKTKNKTSYEEIKIAIKKASETYLKNIVRYSEENIVSQDILGDKNSSIFDSKAGMSLNECFFKVIAWYDNEVGYANKLLDLAQYIDN